MTIDFSNTPIDKDILYHYYIELNYSQRTLRKLFNCSRDKLSYAIKKFGFKKTDQMIIDSMLNTLNNRTPQQKFKTKQKRKQTWKNKDKETMEKFKQKVKDSWEQYWANLTDEQLLEFKTMCKQAQAKLTPQKKQDMYQKISMSNRQTWANKTQKEKQEIIEKIKKTNSLKTEEEKQTKIQKFKTTWYGASPEQKLKRKQNIQNSRNNMTPEQKEQIEFNKKQHLLEKYGVTNVAQLEDVKKKHSNNWNNKTEEERNKIKQKIKQTCKKVWKNKDQKEINEITDRIFATKRKNNTWSVSEQENKIYDILVNTFDYNDVIRQYKCKEYPFHCDFYIKSLKLFIEINFNWTHGGIPYVETNEDCIRQLNEWTEKSQTSKFYKNAIRDWTQRDVVKLNYLITNRLNYQIFYNWDEFNNWLNSGMTVN